MAAESEDVPPLEDMSELLQQVQALKEYKNKTSDNDNTYTASTSNLEKQPLPKRSDIVTKNTQPKTNEPNTGSKKQNSSSSFGGFKKGFLFGAPVPKQKSSSKVTSTKDKNVKTSCAKQAEDIPFLKAKSKEERSPLEMPDVQSAMSASEALLQNKEWLTEDLLSNIQKNETLANRLSDPSFTRAISEFQTNPQAAMLKYQNNPEMQQFLKDFCGILGDHFSTIGEKQPVAPPTVQYRNEGAEMSVRSSTNPKQATAEDEKKMQEILSDPSIQKILMDSSIQALFAALKNEPGEAQRLLQEGGPSMQMKVKRLVDAGLLSFQR